MINNHMINESCSEFPANYQFNGIDITKFICAFMVCIIHIDPFNVELLGIDKLNYLNFGLQHYLCRIAVPFYFAASGFLLFRKTSFFSVDKNRVKGYCFKILRLLGTWTVLLFVGGSNQLWYLGALVIAVILLNVFIKKGMSIRSIVIISFFLFVIGLLGDSYYGLIEPLKNYTIPRIIIVGYETIFTTTRNGVFFGLIFVLIGAIFAQKSIVINSRFAVAGFFISLIIMFFEVFLLQHYSQPRNFNMYISLLPVVFFLFYLATHIQLKDRPVFRSLRVIGMVVFFTHLFVNYFVGLAIEIAKNKLGINLSAFQFVITICFTTLLAIIIERLSKKEKYYWVNYLFS